MLRVGTHNITFMGDSVTAARVARLSAIEEYLQIRTHENLAADDISDILNETALVLGHLELFSHPTAVRLTAGGTPRQLST